ncbi:MAG: PqqD family protein [Pseudomonadota bacterium]
MQDADRLVQQRDLVTRHIEQETVLVPVCAGVADLEAIYTLNAVGTVVWECLDGSRTVSQIVDEVVARFEVEAALARQDVEAFLDDMLREGLACERGAVGRDGPA